MTKVTSQSALNVFQWANYFHATDRIEKVVA